MQTNRATSLLLLPIINFANAGRFGTIEIWMSLLKVGVILTFIMLGLIAITAPGLLGVADAGLQNLWSLGSFFPQGWHGFVQALPVALFSFGGFELISLAAAETKDAERAIPCAVNGLLIRFDLFYIGSTCAILILMPWNHEVPGESPFIGILAHLHVSFAAEMFAVLLISCILSSGNALLFAAARTLRTLACRQAAPARFAMLNRSGTPAMAVLATAACLSVAVFLNIFLPHAVFGLLMMAVALFTLVNWALIVAAYLMFLRGLDGDCKLNFAVPLSPYSEYATLLFMVVVAILLLVVAS